MTLNEFDKAVRPTGFLCHGNGDLSLEEWVCDIGLGLMKHYYAQISDDEAKNNRIIQICRSKIIKAVGLIRPLIYPMQEIMRDAPEFFPSSTIKMPRSNEIRISNEEKIALYNKLHLDPNDFGLAYKKSERICALCKCKAIKFDYSFYMHKPDFGVSDFLGASRYVYKKFHIGICEDCKRALEKREDVNIEFAAIPSLLIAAVSFTVIIRGTEIGICGAVVVSIISVLAIMIPLAYIWRFLMHLVRLIRIIINKEDKIDIRNAQIVNEMMREGWRLGRRPG